MISIPNRFVVTSCLSALNIHQRILTKYPLFLFVCIRKLWSIIKLKSCFRYRMMFCSGWETCYSIVIALKHFTSTFQSKYLAARKRIFIYLQTAFNANVCFCCRTRVRSRLKQVFVWKICFRSPWIFISA